MHQPPGEFPVIQLPPNARASVEQMGTKEKFWCRRLDESLWLFKFNRPGHGDDWSEKIASEIAGLLHITHALVELAEFENRRGVVSRDFTENGKHGLVHGNEILLLLIDPDYPLEGGRKVTAHTIESVGRVLDDVVEGAKCFAGYLMLDALIGNSDRHHQNWGIMYVDSSVILAPTFDHATSLGFNLRDEERTDRMTPGRNRSVESFTDKAKSKLYRQGNPEALSPLDAFEAFTASRLDARRLWIGKLKDAPVESFRSIIDRVPAPRMSNAAREFAIALLTINRDRILKLEV